MSLHSQTSLGYVHLTVSNLTQSIRFYEQVVGFQLHERAGNTAQLGAGGDPLLMLTEQSHARPAPGTTGLYHMAILVPTRPALGHVLQGLIDRQLRIGGSDHGVSEALYLSDPEGNGIEIYRDRPRDQWPRENNSLKMTSQRLDYQGLLKERETVSESWTGLPTGTVLGHMHLRVADLAASERFYTEVLGFDLMDRFPGASFVSAGGYHHHIGMNTWESLNAPPPPSNTTGLDYFTVRLPNELESMNLRERLTSAGIAVADLDAGWSVRDPAGIQIVFTA